MIYVEISLLTKYSWFRCIRKLYTPNRVHGNLVKTNAQIDKRNGFGFGLAAVEKDKHCSKYTRRKKNWSVQMDFGSDFQSKNNDFLKLKPISLRVKKLVINFWYTNFICMWRNHIWICSKLTADIRGLDFHETILASIRRGKGR